MTGSSDEQAKHVWDRCFGFPRVPKSDTHNVALISNGRAECLCSSVHSDRAVQIGDAGAFLLFLGSGLLR